MTLTFIGNSSDAILSDNVIQATYIPSFISIRYSEVVIDQKLFFLYLISDLDIALSYTRKISLTSMTYRTSKAIESLLDLQHTNSWINDCNKAGYR